METFRELQKENERLREILNKKITYLIVEEGTGTYNALYRTEPKNIEETKQICERLGYKILFEGQFTPKPENIRAVEESIAEANKTGQFKSQELEKILTN